MAELRLVELSAATIVAVNNMSLKPGQEQFSPRSATGSRRPSINPQTSWQRVVLDANEVVGFVSANFDPEAPEEHFRSVLWRINVDADDQGRGVGRFAVEKLLDEARKRGVDHVDVIYEAGEGGPEAFFRGWASRRSARPSTARSSPRSACSARFAQTGFGLEAADSDRPSRRHPNLVRRPILITCGDSSAPRTGSPTVHNVRLRPYADAAAARRTVGTMDIAQWVDGSGWHRPPGGPPRHRACQPARPPQRRDTRAVVLRCPSVLGRDCGCAAGARPIAA